MPATLQPHPLTALVERQNMKATAYLKRVADRHARLGYGPMAARREKLTRWTRAGIEPARTAQLAIADLHGISAREVDRLGWPGFLHLALGGEAAFEAPWTAAGTVEVLTDVGGPVAVDRRGFLIATSSVLATATTQWATATPALAEGHGRRVGSEAADLFDTRLQALRHLDDTVGADQTYDAALMEQHLIATLLRGATYSAATGRRLYLCAADAARLAGWCAYDGGRTAAAERHFMAALRASGSAGDATSGAITLGFWANLRYAGGDPLGAQHLVDAALADRQKIASPRVVAMLHGRAARAHSKAGGSTAAWRHMDAAFAAYSRAAPAEQDLPSMYWITKGELHEIAASSALTLGEPHRALEHFEAAVSDQDPYDTAKEARGTGIYLARQAEAHLALGDIDAALDTGHRVLATLGDVDSARTASTLADLRAALTPHKAVPAVQEFLTEAA